MPASDRVGIRCQRLLREGKNWCSRSEQTVHARWARRAKGEVPFLPKLRDLGLLGCRFLAQFPRYCRRRVRRPEISRAVDFSLGTIVASLDDSAVGDRTF